jgi:glucosamine kinase
VTCTEQYRSDNACDKSTFVAFFMGIDGGGSKTTCVVGDEASRIAQAAALGSNITRVGEENARRALHQAIRDACAAAKIVPEQLRKTCIGVAGAGRQEVARAVRTIAGEVISGEIDVAGDMEVALQAAFGAEPGIIVIAGTGSIAYGRDRQGRVGRAGGWGFAISDEGSAHWIGRAAVAALLLENDRLENDKLENDKLGNDKRENDRREKDRREKDHAAAGRSSESSILFAELKSFWRVGSLEELILVANSHPDFASLLPAVVAASDEGDEVSRHVLDLAAGELVKLAEIVLQRLFWDRSNTAGPVPVAMAGGVFCHVPAVREAFGEKLRKLDPRLVLKQEVVDPVDGALQMARQSASASNF